MDRQLFQQMYEGQAPWDTGRPQPAIVALAEAGRIRGSVLDVGCGSGENLLYLAAKGHQAWGLDFVPLAIERGQGQGRPAWDCRSFPRRRRLGAGQAGKAIRHRDRLRAVPHLCRRGAPAVRPGARGSPPEWRIIAPPLLLRRGAGDGRAETGFPAGTPRRLPGGMEGARDRAHQLRVDPASGWAEVQPRRPEGLAGHAGADVRRSP